MAGPALVLVHGRSQQMPAASRTGAAEEAAFVLQKKRSWLAGLAKGLVLAGLSALDEGDVWFPYYGNRFADAIAARERAGLPGPDLEIAAAAPARPPSTDEMILDAARLLGFTPAKEAPTLDVALPIGEGRTTPGIAAAEEAWAGGTDPLFVTAGSPLGYPVVERNLLPAGDHDAKRAAPAMNGAQVPWLNAFDAQDFVALVHPLAGFFTGDLREERTFNPSDPHSIQDYLSDPDVPGPVGRAMAGSAPW